MHESMAVFPAPITVKCWKVGASLGSSFGGMQLIVGDVEKERVWVTGMVFSQYLASTNFLTWTVHRFAEKTPRTMPSASTYSVDGRYVTRPEAKNLFFMMLSQ